MELRQGGDSTDWFFLAMSQERLGDKEKARQWYDRATLWMEKNQATNEELRRFRGSGPSAGGEREEELIRAISESRNESPLLRPPP